MKKSLILVSTLLVMMSFLAITGCGGEEKAQDAESTIVATHDCDGGCGMTKMSAEQTTEIDGKFYCSGCAKHMQEGNHEGHNH